jgi:histidinol dehydrogenase
MLKILTKEELLKVLKSRSQETEENIVPKVREIINRVREKGDQAVFYYTAEFDKAIINGENILVKPHEIKEALESIDAGFIEALNEGARNIKEYHKKQIQKDWQMEGPKGSFMGQKIIPLKRVGLYIPGGKAAYPSTVLMNGIPALVAGVEEIIITTPPNSEGKINPYILAAAHSLGIDKIYKVGGAQAIAALTFGTETIPKVDKIVGPGNIFVATAKALVFGNVAIDMIAGPSEILIIADSGGVPDYIAADLLSQGEHDPLSSTILLTTDKDLALKVQREVEKQLAELPKSEIAGMAIENYSGIVITSMLDEAVELSNLIAPEHLELMVERPEELMDKVRNAGSIFLGRYTPEALGDYFAGPNHVLPTSGSARFASPLGVYDFVKRSSYLYYSKEALMDCGDKVVRLADAEGLEGHSNAIKVRLKDYGK